MLRATLVLKHGLVILQLLPTLVIFKDPTTYRKYIQVLWISHRARRNHQRSCHAMRSPVESSLLESCVRVAWVKLLGALLLLVHWALVIGWALQRPTKDGGHPGEQTFFLRLDQKRTITRSERDIHRVDFFITHVLDFSSILFSYHFLLLEIFLLFLDFLLGHLGFSFHFDSPLML